MVNSKDAHIVGITEGPFKLLTKVEKMKEGCRIMRDKRDKLGQDWSQSALSGAEAGRGRGSARQERRRSAMPMIE